MLFGTSELGRIFRVSAVNETVSDQWFLILYIDLAKELPATLLLRPFNYDTIAIRIYELTKQWDFIQKCFAIAFIDRNNSDSGVSTEYQRRKMKPIVSVEQLHKHFCKKAFVLPMNSPFRFKKVRFLRFWGEVAVVKQRFWGWSLGLEAPDSGTIRIGDRVVFDAKTNLPPSQREIAIVFQNYAFFCRI